jgi:tripartite ATP-independent transporter DctM subunit
MGGPLVLLIAVFALSFVVGVPIAYGMMAAGIAYLFASGQDLGLVADQVANGLFSNYLLLAIPLFIFAANVMNAGTITERLFDISLALVGRLRGGLGHVNVLTNLIFSGISGSAVADAAGPGVMIIKMMRAEDRYSIGFAGALTAATATIGPIIPPSIPMLLYALVANASVGALFLGGVVPGFLMSAALMTAVAVIARRRGYPPDRIVPFAEFPRILARAFLPLLMPVLLLGGIYSGLATPTESAAIAGVYGLFLSTVVYRALGWRALSAVLTETIRSTASVMLIVGSAFILNYAIAREGLPQTIAAFLDAQHLSPLAFLIAVNVLFLILGCFLDVTAMLLIMVPLLVPTVAVLGIDLVHFGVVIVLNIMIGLITPPYGLVLFVLNAVAGVPLKEMIAEVWKFVAVLVFVLLLLVLFPDLVLWLPHQMGFK